MTDRTLSSRMTFALALFRDRPDELTWQRSGGWIRCFFGLIPFIQVPESTVKALAARGLIVRKPGTPDGETQTMVLSDAGASAAHDLPKAYDHEEAIIELRTRRVVRDAIRRATKGTRRKSA